MSQSKEIYSGLSRLYTARGSGTGHVTVGPAKVKACKSSIYHKAMKNIGLCLYMSCVGRP